MQWKKDTLIAEQEKARYLRGMESVLKTFNAKKNGSPAMLDDLVTAYNNCVTKDMQRASIAPAIRNLDYPEADMLLLATRKNIWKNTGLPQCEELLKLKYCIAFPAQTFYVLKENPELPFADSLVRMVSKQFPRQL